MGKAHFDEIYFKVVDSSFQGGGEREKRQSYPIIINVWFFKLGKICHF